MNDTAPHTPLDARRTRMDDGRYLIYFTFEGSDASSPNVAPANAARVKSEPDAQQIATDSAATEAALETIEKPVTEKANKETVREGDGNV
ncbi:MAG: hypothetical protein MSG64_08695 [Pyrinomonadaceae bacterium MAG19_C2-C3]|nr:hypothetical protein [Pyrinomonadaceae bacterium MAG19_C2-C3]